jgi:hypothetical protein
MAAISSFDLPVAVASWPLSSASLCLLVAAQWPVILSGCSLSCFVVSRVSLHVSKVPSSIFMASLQSCTCAMASV